MEFTCTSVTSVDAAGLMAKTKIKEAIITLQIAGISGPAICRAMVHLTIDKVLDESCKEEDNKYWAAEFMKEVIKTFQRNHDWVASVEKQNSLALELLEFPPEGTA